MRFSVSLQLGPSELCAGGGIEQGCITEVFGDSGTGKTQFCHSLAVRAQLEIEQGGAAGCVLYIDTDNTFRPERIQQIADAAGFGAWRLRPPLHRARRPRTDSWQHILRECVDL